MITNKTKKNASFWSVPSFKSIYNQYYKPESKSNQQI
jgi:hypothetical protein